MRTLVGCRVLVAEDEPLVAMLLEDVLLDAGATILGPASTVAEALLLTAQQRPDLAVLDLNLSGETCLAVADALAAAGVPFLVATGFGADDPLPRHAGVQVLQKPYEPTALIDALCRLGSPVRI
ncbi:MAG: response regulator [Rubritepida sp.]|nr:response regulator [Rubritepida sp.]